MKVLIQAGAMIDGVDFLNRTPLHVAAEAGVFKNDLYRFNDEISNEILYSALDICLKLLLAVKENLITCLPPRP